MTVTLNEAIAALERHIGFRRGRLVAVSQRLQQAGIIPTGGPRMPPQLDIGHVVDLLAAYASAGTLTLKEDRTGLWFELLPDPTTPSGQEAIGTVRRGDVKGCSFAFRVRAERWEDGGDRLPLRTLEDVDLYEVTLTGMPAYPTTTASLRVDGAANSSASAAQARAEAAMRARGISV